MEAKIYHNPRCGKSRNTLAILADKGVKTQVIEYLKTPPSSDELRSVISMLEIEPEQLIRKGEKLFKEEFKGKNFTNDEWVQLMVENPVLIERPIVIYNDKAVIGRPPENVHGIL